MTLEEYFAYIQENEATVEGSIFVFKINDIRVNVRLDEHQKYLYLFASLGTYEGIDLEVFLNWLSEVNMFGIRTDGGHVFLNETVEVAVFSKRELFEAVKVEQFSEIIKRFADTQISLVYSLKTLLGDSDRYHFSTSEESTNDILNDEQIYSSLAMMV